MRALLSKYAATGEVEPMLGIAVQPGAEECDAPVETGVMPVGMCR